MPVTQRHGYIAGWAAAFGLAITLVFGCSKAAQSPSVAAPEKSADEEVSFRAFVAPVLTTKCVPCHSGEQPKKGVLLSSYEGVMQQVVAGNAAESELYEVISGPTPEMPPGQPPLPERTVQLIRDWINQGAKNN
jgi:uncharacterized membrane protein